MKDGYPTITEVGGGKLKRVWKLNGEHRYVDHISGYAIIYLFRSLPTPKHYGLVKDKNGNIINKKIYEDLRSAAEAAERHLTKIGLLK